MQLNFFECGLIDDLIYDVTQASIERTGVARYKVVLTGEEKIEFDLWTTMKGKLSFISGGEYYPTCLLYTSPSPRD